MKSIIYSRQNSARNGVEAELLRKSVEDREDTVIAIFTDHPMHFGKGKYAGWRALVSHLDQADLLVIGSVGELPGRNVADLLKILDLLRHHRIRLRLNDESIDTGAGSAATLDRIAAYRTAKLSEAIRRGISRARAAGKMIGRPKVPDHVRRRIQVALNNGDGIRPTARRFNVSAGTVVNIRRETDQIVAKAA